NPPIESHQASLPHGRDVRPRQSWDLLLKLASRETSSHPPIVQVDRRKSRRLKFSCTTRAYRDPNKVLTLSCKAAVARDGQEIRRDCAMHTRARKRKRYAKLLRRWEASRYLLDIHGLQCAPATLAKKACLGIGPEICFVNKIPFYRPTA